MGLRFGTLQAVLWLESSLLFGWQVQRFPQARTSRLEDAQYFSTCLLQATSDAVQRTNSRVPGGCCLAARRPMHQSGCLAAAEPWLLLLYHQLMLLWLAELLDPFVLEEAVQRRPASLQEADTWQFSSCSTFLSWLYQ